jgi:hypothetical protein
VRQQSGHLALAILLLILVMGTTGCAIYTLDVDIAQERLDTATPPLDGTHTVVQSFVSRRPNLCEIELLPAVYQTVGQGTLTLRLCDPAAEHYELARLNLDAAQIQHNMPLHFRFSPQADSAGKTYAICAEGSPGVRIGFWYNSVDAYGDGKLRLDDSSDSGDLRFITRCRYNLPVMLRSTGEGLLRGWWLVVPLSILLLLPGYMLWYGLRLTNDKDPIANLAFSLASSLALIPMVLLWSTVFGLRWQRNLCWAVFAGLALFALLRLFRTRCSDFLPWRAMHNRWLVLVAVMLLAITLWVRFVQIRNLVLPAWVDSPQHALVTELVVMGGQVPHSYEPLLPVQNFIYHFGFHADVAFFHWLSGLDIPQAMLILGQVLNAASALLAYLLTWRLTNRGLAALMAMLIVGLVSYMPAYYVSWGRYTQLTGLVLLPAALVTTLDWLEAGKRDYRLLGAAALLQAGLFLTHARVTIYGAGFVLAYLLCESGAFLLRRKRSHALELWGRATLLTLLALAFSGPWLLRVVGGISASLRSWGRTLSGDPSYNAFPMGLLLVPRNRQLLALAALGTGWGLLRRRKETVWVLVWIVLVALLLNPGWLGLQATGLVNNATAVLSLFLPLSMLSGQALAFAWDRAYAILVALGGRIRPGNLTLPLRVVMSVLVVGVALWSGWGMRSIVNPVTVLATAEDMEAMSWIKEHTSPDAVFLINTRLWQLSTYAGTDGGYWIPQLTGRRTLLPALSYTFGTPDYVRHIAAMAQVVSEAKNTDDSQLQNILEQEGVTHVYIGAKGGPLTPQMFLRSSRYRPVYSNGAVWIFEVTQ